MATAAKPFAPPAESAIPADEFGKTVKLGEQIFLHTPEFAGKYVGNKLTCASCHLDAGRRPDSADVGRVPAVSGIPQQERPREHVRRAPAGCFRYSMNGAKAPPAGDPILVALETYSYWLAKGAPVGLKLPGQGFLKLPPPAQKPTMRTRRRRLHAALRAVPRCGRPGQSSGGKAVFPRCGARVRSTGARGWATSAMRPASSRPTCRSRPAAR